jgi:hypothetical protein
VSVRPEVITLRRPDERCAEQANRLLGVMTHCAFLGHAKRLTVSVGERTLQAHAAPDFPFEPGRAVALDFAIDRTTGLAQDSRGAGLPPLAASPSVPAGSAAFQRAEAA